MRSTITVCLDEKPAEKLAVMEFQQKDALKQEIDHEISLPGRVTLKVLAAISKNQMFSVIGLIDGQQQFMFSGVWDKAVPYFGVKVPNVGYLHLYFEKQ
jgi:hypothetical protein